MNPRTDRILRTADAVAARKRLLVAIRARVAGVHACMGGIGVTAVEERVPGVIAELAEISALLGTLLPMEELPPEAEVVEALPETEPEEVPPVVAEPDASAEEPEPEPESEPTPSRRAPKPGRRNRP
jgi:outer membrane biosynthesis protein TonB